MTGRRLLTWLIGTGLATVAGVLFVYPAQAATQTVDVYPNTDVSIGNWTSRSGGSDNWGRVHRPTGDANDNSYFCSASDATTGIHNAGAAVNPNGSPLPMPDVQQGVTSIQAAMRGKAQGVFLNISHPTVGLTVRINGADIGSDSGSWSGSAINLPFTNSCNNALWWGGWMNEGFTVTPSAGNEWTQSDINTMQFTVFRSGNNRPVRIMSMNAQLTYVTYSTLTQNGYRFYQNANSVTPGAALGSAASTPVDFNRDAYGTAFRLRTAIQTTDERWLRQYGTYKLQYANKGGGTCASPAGGWGDVGTGDIQWNTNSLVANGADIANVSGQPAGTMIPQRYQSANPFSKRQQVAVNSYGIWDFSLRYMGASYGDTFCFRVVNSDGDTQPLSGYTNYPELRITGDISMGFVNASGAPISSPTIEFSGLTSSASCQVSTGILGTNNTRLRVTDNRAVGNWSIDIAASGGAGAAWDSGVHQYSFNDPTGTPPGCANGQLSMDFGAINAAPQTGCSLTGLSPGSNASFTGATPIVIGSGVGAQRFCYWDITNVELSQQIPSSTPPGSYAIGMTITLATS